MKKGFLIGIGLCCITAIGHGQDTNAYQSFFGQESTEWWGVLVDCDYYSFHLIRTTYDTLVDGVLYKKAEHNEIFNDDDYNAPPDFSLLLREDTRTGRLWYRPIDEDEEFLIVDMSLSLGDTITLYRPAGESSGREFVVQNLIDTGSHRTLILKSSVGVREILFIEGVGCSNIIEYPYSWGNGSLLLCCIKDGSQIYHDGPLVGCYGEPYGIRDVEIPKISVFPNPCTDWIEIDGENILSINIYDVHGKNVKSFFDTQGRINLSNLPRGMYFLQILMGTTNVYKTIIKK